MTDFLIKPSVNNRSLFKLKKSINEKGEITKIPIIEEKPLTLYLNNQEIVTIMTIGDYPKYLAIGYLFNQGMLNNIDDVKKIEFHKDLKTVVVRTKSKTNYEEKLKKKVNTSGCAQGTVFGDLFEEINTISLNKKIRIDHQQLMNLSKKINSSGSLFLGEISSEVLADYVAGPSHVMPTNGSARYSSSLSTRTFTKNIPVLSIDKEEFDKICEDGELLASLESLDAHKNALTVRKNFFTGE